MIIYNYYDYDIHSFIHSLTHSLIHSWIHSIIHSSIHSFIHSFHSFIHSFHAFIHSFHFISFHFKHSFIHAFIHSFNHSIMIILLWESAPHSSPFWPILTNDMLPAAHEKQSRQWIGIECHCSGLSIKKDMKCLAEPIPQFFTTILHPGTSAWQWAAWTGWTGPSRWHKSLCRYLWCCWVQDGAVWVKQQKYLLCLYMILVIPLMVTLQRNCATGKCLLRSVPKWLMAKNHTEWISVMLLSWSNSRLAASHLFRKSSFAHLNPIG